MAAVTIIDKDRPARRLTSASCLSQPHLLFYHAACNLANEKTGFGAQSSHLRLDLGRTLPAACL